MNDIYYVLTYNTDVDIPLIRVGIKISLLTVPVIVCYTLGNNFGLGNRLNAELKNTTLKRFNNYTYITKSPFYTACNNTTYNGGTIKSTNLSETAALSKLETKSSKNSQADALTDVFSPLNFTDMLSIAYPYTYFKHMITNKSKYFILDIFYYYNSKSYDYVSYYYYYCYYYYYYYYDYY